MQAAAKAPLLILGAPPRGGNHLLRGLLDHHPELLLPPDEDYFIRHLSRQPLLRWAGMLASAAGAPGFYRRLQKDGHLERINAGHGTEVFGTEGSLDLDAYYQYIRDHHRRWDLGARGREVREQYFSPLLHRVAGDGRQPMMILPFAPALRAQLRRRRRRR